MATMAQERQLVEETVSANLGRRLPKESFRVVKCPRLELWGFLHQPKALVQEGN